MKLGIGSYTYTWALGVPGHRPPCPLTALELVRRAAMLGVKVVQFCDNLPLTSLPDGELDDVINLAAENDIELEIGTRGIADQSNLLAYLALAKRLGARFVRLVVDSQGHEPSVSECVAILRPLLPRFADAGVKLAFENHDRFTAAALISLIEELGTEQTGVCLDTVNSFGALEGPAVVVSKLAPYTLNLHLKDFTISRVSSQMGFVISGCAAGQGRLDIPWLLAQLRAAGRDVNAIIELWTPYGHDLAATIAREAAWAEESVSHLRTIIPD